MFSENAKVTNIGSYESVAADTKSINMRNFHKATIIMQIHDLAAADLHVLVYSGIATATKTSALTFRYALGGAAEGTANCDKLSAWATSADLTLAHGTYDDYMLVIEINASEMDMANNEEWLTVETTTTTGHWTAIAILEPRFTGNRSASALA